MDVHIITYIIVGSAAQMIDGALGMAYGVSSTILLLSIGIPPAIASASVHTAKIFTGGVSELSHLKSGNIDKDLFKRLVIPGVLGGILGAYVLTAVPGKTIKPIIALYLFVMGLVILLKALKKTVDEQDRTRIFPLGIIGGFLDAIGGGGWGPIVTSTLVMNGNHPKLAFGSVSIAEFFVTVAEVATFITAIGLVHWQIIVGLIIGGILAAPLAAHAYTAYACTAYACKRPPIRALRFILGASIMILSVRTICLALI